MFTNRMDHVLRTQSPHGVRPLGGTRHIGGGGCSCAGWDATHVQQNTLLPARCCKNSLELRAHAALLLEDAARRLGGRVLQAALRALHLLAPPHGARAGREAAAAAGGSSRRGLHPAALCRRRRTRHRRRWWARLVGPRARLLLLLRRPRATLEHHAVKVRGGRRRRSRRSLGGAAALQHAAEDTADSPTHTAHRPTCQRERVGEGRRVVA